MGAQETELEYHQLSISRGDDRLGVQVYADPDAYAPDTAGTAGPGAGGTWPPPLVLLCPGMGIPAGYYRPLARRLRDLGLRVAVADLRGTGTSQPPPSRRSRYGFAELVDDVGAVLDHLVPGTSPDAGASPDATDRSQGPVVLLGHSLGGQASLLHLAISGDQRVAGLGLITAGLPYWRSFRGPRRLAVLPFTQVIGAASTLLGFWPGWGFGGRQARGVMRDWAYTGRTGRFPAIDGVDMAGALESLRTPVLAVSVESDQFTPATTVDHLCAMMPSAPIERVHVTGEQLGARPDHFRWARTPGPIADRIAAFASAAGNGERT